MVSGIPLMVSGIPLVLGQRTRMLDPCVYETVCGGDSLGAPVGTPSWIELTWCIGGSLRNSVPRSWSYKGCYKPAVCRRSA